MNKTIRSGVTLLLLLSGLSGLRAANAPELKLWYRQPATTFEETLVLGNGRLGASVFGGPAADSIYLNDATLWTGTPSECRTTKGYQVVPLIRAALAEERYDVAESLQHFLQGPYSESYAPLGTLYIRSFPGGASPTSYCRELSLDRAVATTRFKVGNTACEREYFTSHPDGVLVIRLKADRPRSLSFDLGFGSQLKHRIRIDGDRLIAFGVAPAGDRTHYRPGRDDAADFSGDRGIRFAVVYTIASTDGRRVSDRDGIGVRDAREAVILVSVATSFNGFDRDPATEGADCLSEAEIRIEEARRRSFGDLLRRHTSDYRALFDRFDLRLGDGSGPDLPTDQRLERYETGAADHYLERLHVQFGRYLLISSSRTPGVPANLQGIWNPYMEPPWRSNYTININLPENYWLAEKSGLPEMHEPLMAFIGHAARKGAATARDFFGTRGWAMCHNSDIWAMTHPAGNYGDGRPCWVNWYLGGVWLSTHLWEHYRYTLDTAFLRERGYPLMKGAVDFCMDWLVKDREGYWITSPSTSPENTYVTDTGFRGATLYGATGDLAMIRELMGAYIEASELLGCDSLYREQVRGVMEQLRPYRIGKKGNLQEWYHDWEDDEPTHRHTPHLFGLFPGTQISPTGTPELAAACRRTLELRTDESTGWAMGWRINLWARLQDGEHAYRMYRRLLRYVAPYDDGTGRHNRGGTCPNLFNAHPPFQIDGNFGAASGVMEMLMQSHEGYIHLLPALPQAWSEGSFRGLKAPGNITVNAVWREGRVLRSEFCSPTAQRVDVLVNGTRHNLALKAGQRIVLNL